MKVRIWEAIFPKSTSGIPADRPISAGPTVSEEVVEVEVEVDVEVASLVSVPRGAKKVSRATLGQEQRR